MQLIQGDYAAAKIFTAASANPIENYAVSQLMNRKIAKQKLEQLLTERELAEQKKQTHSAWREHTRIVRGNPVRVYTGMDFKLKKK